MNRVTTTLIASFHARRVRRAGTSPLTSRASPPVPAPERVRAASAHTRARPDRRCAAYGSELVSMSRKCEPGNRLISPVTSSGVRAHESFLTLACAARFFAYVAVGVAFAWLLFIPSGHHNYLEGRASEVLEPEKVLDMIGGRAGYRRFVLEDPPA